MKKKKDLKYFFVLLCLIIISCSTEKLPYEDTFKNRMIASIQVEPIVETIIVEARLDSGELKKFFEREFNNNKASDLSRAKMELEEMQKKYDQSIKIDGIRMADGVYLNSLNRAKEKYNQLLSGMKDSELYEFYYNRITYPTIFEQVTIKYRLAKDGPLMVGRYRTDIFQGDTSFYELKNDRTITDYIK